MKKPTKAQRHKIYKAALKHMERDADNGWTPFMCCALDLACFAELNEFPDRENLSELFPEFAASKPKGADYVWFSPTKSGNATRFATMHKLIADTAPTPRK
jgi:hypothetical protein